MQQVLKLVQSGLRLLFIGAASAVLALAGILLSIVAAIRRAYVRLRGIDDPSEKQLQHELHSSPLRDRDHRGHKPPPRHRSTHASRSPSLEARDASVSRTLAPLRSSPEPMLPSERRQPNSPPRERRRRRRPAPLSPPSTLPTIDSTMEFVEPSSSTAGRPALDVRGNAAGRDPVRALSSPAPVLSDSSPTQSTEPSIESESVEGGSRVDRSRSPIRVLKRMKEQHTQFRERCLIRVHSMPTAKPAKPARRTDPYQAPYYFPTPLSPDADIYVEQVLSERQGARVTDPISFRQYRDRVPLSPRTSPKSKEELLPPPTPDIVVSETAPAPTESTPEPPVRPSLREKSHRWSWHLPHLHAKSAQDEAVSQETAEKPQTPAKFLFGHHRRRNGTASEDVKAKRASLPAQS
ncbi:uncharacterized protein TRAVEDRAFT_25386 [Trametes versicolor FP-101664 SS1]|uniref:uncharacterized protein n=1 Tax=Trametes versicolor (strain FP-101664) TaxID=717944 RepID=UPI0004623AC2|nr:uncharacterized protein TRAVEDRAFT_25386 [Trametes versicolor FP-101664 SS1]EIW64078.1 hypothetical protein TRAVEDRAFT_25386 [Trametes versicolor FP-101664 SS1]